jgi:phage gpG-like protein
MSDDAYTMNTKNLDQLIKALKNNMSKGRVGILGGKTMRNNTDSGPGKSVSANKGKAPKSGIGDVTTNAAVGAIHEFGIPGRIPQRSFLRVPIAEQLPKELEKSGAFSKDELNKVIKEESLKPWIERIVLVAVNIVTEAFDTGGFGKWPKWKDPNYSNNSGQVLVDTTQLRNSITGDVK